MIEIVPSIVRVHKDRAMIEIKPKILGLRSHYDRVYIGVTNDPDRRAKEHEGGGWEKMFLLYEALSAAIACDLEQDLIDYCGRCNFKNVITNRSAGGEWIAEGKSFVYVLVADRKQRRVGL